MENKFVGKVLDILELISKNPQGLTCTEIHKALNLPKSSVYDILQALYKKDAIYYNDEKLKTYVIGSRMFAIGSVYTKNSSFINISKPLLEDFSEKHNLICYGSKRISEKIVSVYKYETLKSKIQMADEGMEVTKFHSTAIGKAFLAFDNFPIPDRLTSYTKNTITDIGELAKELEDIKQKGYSVENSETEEHIKGFAVPIYNFEKRVCGVISAYGLSYELNNIEELVKEFMKIAKEISRKLGY